MKAIEILKYTLPAAAPLGIVTLTVALSSHSTLPSQIRSTEVEVGHQTATSTNSATDPSVDIKINGQPVTVSPNSITEIDTGNGQATVQVSGGSQTTTTTAPNGSVSITVSSSSNNSSSSSHSFVSGSSGGTFNSNSSVRVQTNGTGNVSASN